MKIKMLTRYSPRRGERLEAGAIVDVEPEVAADLIQRKLAAPVATEIEHAVGPGQ